jgi:hypothetical protein
LRDEAAIRYQATQHVKQQAQQQGTTTNNEQQQQQQQQQHIISYSLPLSAVHLACSLCVLKCLAIDL